jgi:hypothetical protein
LKTGFFDFLGLVLLEVRLIGKGDGGPPNDIEEVAMAGVDKVEDVCFGPEEGTMEGAVPPVATVGSGGW